MINKTKVLIVDDHPAVREGLRAMLSSQQDLEIVGEAENGEKAVQLAGDRLPDVVLMDVAMPVCSGDQATRRIVRMQPKCKILALSSYIDDHAVRQMLRAGAAGYLVKLSTTNELIKAIRTVRQSQGSFFSPGIVAKPRGLSTPFSKNNSQRKILSSKEIEVVKLIASGLTNKEIAKQLELGQWELKYCREQAMSKLKLRGVAELTRYAITNGLVTLVEGDSPVRQNPAVRSRIAPIEDSVRSQHVNKCISLEERSYESLAKAIDASMCQDERFFEPPSELASPDPEEGNFLPQITNRERQVATAIAEGLTNKDIATRLMVGVRTVETHRENLMRKLKIKNVAGITKFALANGWLAKLGEERTCILNKEFCA